MAHGWMVLTVMPSLPSSWAITLPICLIAAFEPLYAVEPFAANSAMTDPMMMMRPPFPWARMCWAAARQVKKVANCVIWTMAM